MLKGCNEGKGIHYINTHYLQKKGKSKSKKRKGVYCESMGFAEWGRAALGRCGKRGGSVRPKFFAPLPHQQWA